MKEQKFEFQYEVYNDISELNKEDADLLDKARTVTKQAYAPYSNFYVGAVAKLNNGEISIRNQPGKCFLPGWYLCRKGFTGKCSHTTSRY